MPTKHLSAPTASGSCGRGCLTIITRLLTWAGRARGVRVPEDLRDWLRRHQSVQLLMPELATVVQPIEGMVRTAQRVCWSSLSYSRRIPRITPNYPARGCSPVELHLGVICTLSRIWIRSCLDTSAPDELHKRPFSRSSGPPCECSRWGGFLHIHLSVCARPKFRRCAALSRWGPVPG